MGLSLFSWLPGLFHGLDPAYEAFYISLVRRACPLLSFLLLLRCALPLLTFRREPEIWAWLKFTDGSQVAVTHWENVIGRSKSSDINIALSTVSRNHAVLTRYDDGSWTITDASSKTGTWVNGEKVDIRAVHEGDTISIGGVDMELQVITRRQEQLQAQLRTRGSGGWSGLLGLLILTLLQAVMLAGFLLNGPEEEFRTYFLGFGAVTVCQWVLFLFYLMMPSPNFSQAQISGSRRKEIRGRAQCSSSHTPKAGTRYRDTAKNTAA